MPPINCTCSRARRFCFAVAMVLTTWIMVTPPEAQDRPLATPLNSNEKIHITSDTLEADNKDRSFLFKGQVKVVQGETVVTSDALLIRYRSEKDSQESETASETGKIEKIEATGNVIILFDGRTAKAPKAVYLADQQTLQLIGEKSTIIDGPNKIIGSKITLYRNEDRIKVESSSKNPADRVTATFFPGQKAAD